MRLKEKTDVNKIYGVIALYSVVAGNWEQLQVLPNMVVKQASDILAAAISGERVVNGMYLAFENDSAAVNYIPDSDNTASTYADSVADRSFVRIPLVSRPSVVSSEDKTEVSFLAVTDGSSFHSSVLVEDGVSNFYHSALISMDEDNIDNQIYDSVFSCADFTTSLDKIAGAQLGVRWTITFPKA